MKSKAAIKILIVEDDQLLLEALLISLQKYGYSVDCVTNGLDAANRLSEQTYDLVVLDLTLPGMDGLDLLRHLRTELTRLPVLIVTARSSLQDRVKGLDLGANDYLIKPFALAELEARIRSLLRFTYFNNQNILQCGNLKLDYTGRMAMIDQTMLALTEREYAVLESLLKEQGRVVSKARLVDDLFLKDIDLSFNALDIVVHRLRKKLGLAKCTIKALKGVGYVIGAL
jgi:DNA-binding response OmpR family regulator